MALRWLESFDGDLTNTNLDARYTSGTITSTQSSGRTGLWGYFNQQMWTKLLTAQSTWIIGFALTYGSPATDAHILQLLDGATVQVYLKANGDGTLSLYRGDDTLLATITGTFGAIFGTMHYVELKVVIGNSGSYSIRYDGAVQASGAADTQNSANATADRFTIGDVGKRLGYDDLYVCDGSGSTNNDFLGMVSVGVIRPGGAGNTTGLAIGGSGPAGTNYGSVNETSLDAGVTLVQSATPGDKDTYAYGNTGLSNRTVVGIMTTSAMRTDTAGPRTVSKVIRSAGTDYDGSNVSLNTATWGYYTEINETDPATSAAWTLSGLDSMEVGVKVQS